MKSLRFVAAAICAAGLLAACGGGGGGTTTVATSDTTVPATAATVQALTGQQFTFANGILGTAGSTNLMLNSNGTFNLTTADGAAAGGLTFGSCIFTITSSTTPQITGPFPKAVTFANCSIKAATNGRPANGLPAQTDVFFDLNGVLSLPKQSQVTVNANGTVTITNPVTGATVTGTVSTGAATGGTGG
jgi:hypothetical protein